MVRISFVECNTKKGPQITMRLHTRITEGDDKGYIATSDAIWPRAYALDQDLELLRSSSIKDLMLRFGQKTVPVLDENGEPTVSPDYTLRRQVDTKMGTVARYLIKKNGDEVMHYADGN